MTSREGFKPIAAALFSDIARQYGVEYACEIFEDVLRANNRKKRGRPKGKKIYDDNIALWEVWRQEVDRPSSPTYVILREVAERIFTDRKGRAGASVDAIVKRFAREYPYFRNMRIRELQAVIDLDVVREHNGLYGEIDVDRHRRYREALHAVWRRIKNTAI